MGVSRTVLARRVGCAPVTIKKIERDERRPSMQIAELLAEQLHIPATYKNSFLRMARGEYIKEIKPPLDLALSGSSRPSKSLKPDRFKVLRRLEALPDQKLFGIDSVREQIIETIAQTDRPWLISLEGLGGIGKTSLANEIVHHFLDSDRFVDIAWVSAKQEEYITGRGIQPIKTKPPDLTADVLVDLLLAQLSDGPYPIHSPEAKRAALFELLQEKPCLIVIDNLETVTDYQTLLPLLRQMARPSKFLITSRRSLQNESDVYSHSLAELSETASLAFLQYEATLQRVLPLLNAEDHDLKMIYTTVGGNPLALKLVIGQSHVLPLHHILNNLQQAKGDPVDQLYTYIYWQAWQMLDQDGRHLLLSLPIVPNGTFDQLQAASKLGAMALQAALNSLRRFSLIEIRGELREPRYRIHRLTESFLMNEVLRWQSTPERHPSPERGYFRERVQAMIEHWQANEALEQSETEALDQEKEGILKALHLGLDIDGYWPLARPLIFSLTGYMERRGHWQAWQRTLERAIEMAQQENDPESEIKLSNLRGRVLQRQKLQDQVIQNYRHVIQLARKMGNSEEEARASSNLGFALIKKGNFWRSEVYSCHALQIFIDLGHQHGQAHTYNHLGSLYLRTGQWDTAKVNLQQACDIWQEIGDNQGLQYGLGNLGFLHNSMDQPQVAITYLTKQLHLLQEIGERGELANVYLNLSASYEQLKDRPNTLAFARQAETGFEEQNNLLGVCKSWELIGAVHQQANNWEMAEEYFDAAIDGYQNLQDTEGHVRTESRKLTLFAHGKQWGLAEESATVLRELGETFPMLKEKSFLIDALTLFDRLKDISQSSSGE